MLTITNDGQTLVSTNYWDLPHARQGLLYVSGNAGALRLLVPPAAEGMVEEMRTGKSVMIEPSTTMAGCVDVVFDDGSPEPFCVTIDRRQFDRKIEPGQGVPLFVYTKAGEQFRLAATIKG